jgi:hypothetical protein
VEITLRLNAEFGDSEPYTPARSKSAPTKCRIFAKKESNIAACECQPKHMTKSKAITRVNLERSPRPLPAGTGERSGVGRELR